MRKEALLRAVKDQARRLATLAKNLEEASELRDAIEAFVGEPPSRAPGSP